VSSRSFKQTLGLVPHDLTPDGFGNQSSIMPITRTVLDCALMLQAMAGPDPCDPHSLGLPVQDFVAAARPEGDLAGRHIAWRPYLGNRKVAHEVMALCEAAVAVLAELGAVVEPMEDDFENAEPVWLVLTQSFWNARFRRYVPEFGARMSLPCCARWMTAPITARRNCSRRCSRAPGSIARSRAGSSTTT
jgi:aspartyl-tRNA(Asn)/glutamyl-tRNA(Gln) amidotransferase subunit A